MDENLPLKKEVFLYCTNVHPVVMIHFQTDKSRLPIHCHYFQVHSDSEW